METSLAPSQTTNLYEGELCVSIRYTVFTQYLIRHELSAATIKPE